MASTNDKDSAKKSDETKSDDDKEKKSDEKKGPVFYGPDYGIHPSTPEASLIPHELEKEIDAWTPKFFGPTPWGLVEDALPKMFPAGRVFIKLEQLVKSVERLLERFGKRVACVHKVDHHNYYIELKQGQWKLLLETINPKPRHYYLRIVKSYLEPAKRIAITPEDNLEAWVAARLVSEEPPKRTGTSTTAPPPQYAESPYLPAGKPSFAIPCQMLFSTHFSDISIQCGGKDEDKTTIPAHRVILGMASPFWHNVFVTHPGSKILNVPYPTFVVKEVLSVLYQGTLDVQVLEQNLELFRKISVQYGLDCIPKLACHLAYKLITYDNIREKLLNFVHVHDVKLIQVALTFIEKHTDTVMALDEITSLANDHPQVWEKLVPVAVKDPAAAKELLSKTKPTPAEQEPQAKRQKQVGNEFTNNANPILPTFKTDASVPLLSNSAVPLLATVAAGSAPVVASSTTETTAVVAAAAKPSSDTTATAKASASSAEPIEWQGEILFRGQLTQGISSPMVNSPAAFQDMNILSYLNPLYKGMRIAFDPSKYPVGSGQFALDNPGWLDLKRDLLAAGRLAGQHLSASSCEPKGKKKTAAVKCLNSRLSQAGYKKPRGRGRGRALPKRPSSKPTSRDECCPFRFNLGVDENSFYLSCGCGTLLHKFHGKLAPEEPKAKAKVVEEAPAVKEASFVKEAFIKNEAFVKEASVEKETPAAKSAPDPPEGKDEGEKVVKFQSAKPRPGRKM